MSTVNQTVVLAETTEQTPKLALAEALILGDSLKRPARHLLRQEENGELSGCALSGALLASCVPADELMKEAEQLMGAELCELPCLRQRWPFLTRERIHTLCFHYGKVLDGTETIEYVARYAALIESSAEFEKDVPEIESVSDNSAKNRNRPAVTKEQITSRFGFYPYSQPQEGDRAFQTHLGKHVTFTNGSWIVDQEPVPFVPPTPIVNTPRTIEVVRVD